MPDRSCSITVRRREAASPAILWALAADPNRWDRVVGAPPSAYRYEATRIGKRRIGQAALFWGDTSWVERGEWVEGRYFRGERRFREGPVETAGYEVEVTPSGDAAELRATAYLRGRDVLSEEIRTTAQLKMEGALARHMDAIAGAVVAAGAAARETADGEPAAALARRVLLRAAPDEVLHGARTSVAEGDFAFASERLAGAPIEEGLRARITDFLRRRTDSEVAQVRPYELASAWGEPPRDVLRAFLHAARAGLYDLRWELLCPFCRVASGQVAGLDAAPARGRCLECDLDYNLDFARNVEAVFQANRGIRAVDTAVYCAGSPWFRPHVLACLELPPRAVRELPLQLPYGSILCRALPGPRRVTLPDVAGADRAVRLVLGAEGLAATGTRGPAGADTAFALVNDTDLPAVLLFERADYRPRMVLGTDILAMPEFHGLFSTEAPAAGMDVEVSSLAVLFSDVTASTALYERVGDARAYALIQEQFRIVAGAVDRAGGAIVKTMGDAVMAAFPSPAPAVLAAIAIAQETRAALGQHGLSLKVGLHAGPCLLVRANDRLDLFGTTVNLAARLEALAEGDQVVMLEELTHHPDVARVLRERGVRPVPFRASLRGLAEARDCISFRA